MWETTFPTRRWVDGRDIDVPRSQGMPTRFAGSVASARTGKIGRTTVSGISRRKTRALAAGLALLLAGGALAGCSASGGRETIRFAFAKPEAIPYMRELVQEYNSSQDEVNVVLDTSGIDAVSAGFVRGDPPDIALNNYNQETARFIQRCAMSDLSDTAAAQSVREDLTPFMDQFGVCPGRTSALPYSVMGAAVIYNKEIFEQNDLEVPTTWDELIEVCETLEAAGVTPFYATFADNWTIGQGWYDYTVGGMLDTVAFFDELAEEGTERRAELGGLVPEGSGRTGRQDARAVAVRQQRRLEPRLRRRQHRDGRRARPRCTCRARGRSARSRRRPPTSSSACSRCR